MKNKIGWFFCTCAKERKRKPHTCSYPSHIQQSKSWHPNVSGFGEGQKGPFLIGLDSWSGHKEESEVLPVVKSNLLKKEHLKEKVGQAKKGTGTRLIEKRTERTPQGKVKRGIGPRFIEE